MPDLRLAPGPRSPRATPSPRGVAVVAALSLSLVLAACGQKEGIEGAPPPGGYVAADGSLVDAQGNVVAPGAGGGVPGAPGAGSPGGGGPGGGPAGGGAGAGGPAPGGAPGAPAAPGAPGAPGGAPGEGGAPPTAAPQGGGDTTGVTDDTIVIGVHAPVTGAAAVPQSSFERAVGTYFKAVNDRGGIFGRKVQVLFEDDQFRPDVARVKCKEMAEQQKAFLLIGAAGADQIDACARYADSVGVPYISGGVHQTRPGQSALGDLSSYYAVSLAYEQQVPLLARLYDQQFGGSPVVVITADNDSLDGYHAAAESAIKGAAGGDFEYAERIPKNTQSEALAIGTRICNSGAEAVIWNASPSTLLNVSKSMVCTPTFVGPGLTNGLNILAAAGCPNIDDALFYSPFPGLDVMRRNADFVRDYRAKNGADPDDIGAAIYGLEKVVVAMLQAGGENLSREGFLAGVAKKRTFETGVFPTARFDSRFGGTAMHLLRADCGRREYVTVRQSERP